MRFGRVNASERKEERNEESPRMPLDCNAGLTAEKQVGKQGSLDSRDLDSSVVLRKYGKIR